MLNPNPEVTADTVFNLLRHWLNEHESGGGCASTTVSEIEHAWKTLTQYNTPACASTLVQIVKNNGLDNKLRALFQKSETEREYLLATRISAE